VDHGICLHSDCKLRTVLWGWAGTTIGADLLADIAAFAGILPGVLADSLAAHVTDAEITALAKRTQAVLDDPTMPLPTGVRPIPWPAF